MLYRLTGFTNEHGFRAFTFECTGIENYDGPTEFTVRVDLAMALKHRIPLQELPLLCDRVLESRGLENDQRDFTYTEAAMIEYAQTSAALAAEIKEHKRSIAQRRADAKLKPKVSTPAEKAARFPVLDSVLVDVRP